MSGSLREAELWAATATITLGIPYPYEEPAAEWKTVLLQQFHDILPCSSIAWVHQETEREYGRIATKLTSLIDGSLSVLSGDGDTTLAANSSPYPQRGVPAMGLQPVVATTSSEPRRTGDSIVLEDDSLRVEVDGRSVLVSI